MYEKQNKHYAFSVFPERNVQMSYFVLLFSGRKKLEEIRICFSLGMFVLLWRQRKSSLTHSPSNENPPKSPSDQLAEIIENRRCCCVKHSYTFGFTTRCLQNAMEESYRNKAIQACLLL